jgi:hypothetical protein
MPVVKFFACLDFERKYSFCKRLTSFKNKQKIYLATDYAVGAKNFSPFASVAGKLRSIIPLLPHNQ